MSFVKKTCNNIGNTVWRNKGSIAVGTAAIVAVLAPDAVVQGATTVATGATQAATSAIAGTTQAAIQSAGSNSGSGFFSFLLLAMLFVAGLWFFVGFVRFR